jgi:hypothetical protein
MPGTSADTSMQPAPSPPPLEGFDLGDVAAHPRPFVGELEVHRGELSRAVDHASNVQYVSWLDRVAELHCDALGYTRQRMLEVMAGHADGQASRRVDRLPGGHALGARRSRHATPDARRAGDGEAFRSPAAGGSLARIIHENGPSSGRSGRVTARWGLDASSGCAIGSPERPRVRQAALVHSPPCMMDRNPSQITDGALPSKDPSVRLTNDPG